MHSGAYATLEDAIRHHFRPEDNLRGYNGDGLPVTHEDMVLFDSETHDEMLSYLSTNLADCSSMGEPEVDALAAFLRSMTDPSARDMSHLVPVSVPSGLSID